jgi:SAM-dependent methyltransferase
MNTEVAEQGAEVDCAESSCPLCGEIGTNKFLQAPDRFHGGSELYELLKCPSCSLVWLANPPAPVEMGRHYGEDYDRSVAGAGEDPNHWSDRRDTLLTYKSTGAVLDLGCSSGGFLTSLKGPTWKRYGIEMSPAVAERARAKCNAEVFVGDILAAPFVPKSFDAITCFHVFEHLYQPREVLEKVHEWLKPNGIFYTMMPNIDSAGARIFGSYWYPLELPRHLCHFSPAALKSVAASVGLEVVSLTTHREMFIEQSVRYLLDQFCRSIGIDRTPLAKLKKRSVPYRAIRKMVRLTLSPAVDGLASLIGEGESIHGIFRKGSM